MFTTCFKCKKQNEYWESRRLQEPIKLNGKVLSSAFAYSQYFCPVVERRVKSKIILESEEKFLITDCLNGDRVEVRERPSLVKDQKPVAISTNSQL